MAKKRKKKPKVALSSQNVCIMATVIVIICVLFLGVNYLFTRDTSDVSTKEESKLRLEWALGESGEETAFLNENEALQAESNSTDSASDETTTAQASTVQPKKIITPPAKPIPQSSKTPALPPSKPALPKFTVPKANGKAMLIFVIDDAGMNVANVKKYTALPFDITIAVLPRLVHTKECAAEIQQAKKELILHQPMQAENLSVNPGKGAVLPNMDLREIAVTLRENVTELGSAIRGMNNHEGSLITSDAMRIGTVLDVCMEMGLYYIDSRTAVAEKNRVREAATLRGIAILERNAPFIDNELTREAMLERIYDGLKVANSQGYAIMIGHVDKSANILPPLLEDLYPELVRQGYTFAFPSQIRK